MRRGHQLTWDLDHNILATEKAAVCRQDGNEKLSKAGEYVRDGLAALLPPRVPLPVSCVIRATFNGKGKVRATVELFDGRWGEVQISKWATQYEDAWAIRWLELDGGAINWNGAAWERIRLAV